MLSEDDSTVGSLCSAGHYPASSLLRTPPPPSPLRPLSRDHRLYGLPCSAAFCGGRRRASPVAWRVLVTVLPLPPRRRATSHQPDCAAVCCLRLPSCRLGLRGCSLSGPPLRSLALRPGDSPSFCNDAVDELQVIGFPPPCHLATGLLAFTLAGLTPAEHTSLSWTHNRTCTFQRIRLSIILFLNLD